MNKVASQASSSSSNTTHMPCRDCTTSLPAKENQFHLHYRKITTEQRTHTGSKGEVRFAANLSDKACSSAGPSPVGRFHAAAIAYTSKHQTPAPQLNLQGNGFASKRSSDLQIISFICIHQVLHNLHHVQNLWPLRSRSRPLMPSIQLLCCVFPLSADLPNSPQLWNV